MVSDSATLSALKNVASTAIDHFPSGATAESRDLARGVVCGFRTGRDAFFERCVCLVLIRRRSISAHEPCRNDSDK